jgi:hypothetical protein
MAKAFDLQLDKDEPYFMSGCGHPTYMIAVGARADVPRYLRAVVWFDPKTGQANCTDCVGILVAMSESCRHSMAVKRAYKSGRLVLPPIKKGKR